jgi:hypothetical protein
MKNWPRRGDGGGGGGGAPPRPALRGAARRGRTDQERVPRGARVKAVAPPGSRPAH